MIDGRDLFAGNMTMADSLRTIPICEIRTCGCWFVNLAQGQAVLTCKTHADEVSKICR